MYEVFFYKNAKGECPVEELLDRMPKKVLGKFHKWIVKLERDGPDLPRPYADVVTGKIRELRLVFGSSHYRFFYFFYGKKIILTHGFLKKTRQIPVEQIKKAETLMYNFYQEMERGEL